VKYVFGALNLSSTTVSVAKCPNCYNNNTINKKLES